MSNIARNLRSIAYSATAAAADNYATNTGGAAAAALVGDSLTMEETEGPSRIIAIHQLNQTAGGLRIITNSGHDTTRGFPMTVAAGNLGNLLNRGIPFEVQSSETLRLQVYGTGVSGDVESGIMLLERRISGGGGNYIDFDQLRARRFKQTAVKVSLAAAAAGYGTEESLAAETSTLWGSEEYAVLGMTSSVNVAGICLRGPDTGNVKIACPGNAVDAWPPGSDYFPELSRVFKSAFIPVIKANNALGTFLSFIADENVTAIDATLHLMLLKKGR